MTEQSEFKKFADSCKNRIDWQCTLTRYACKDYMCKSYKEFKLIQVETKKIISKECVTCATDMAVQFLTKIRKHLTCPKCGRGL